MKNQRMIYFIDYYNLFEFHLYFFLFDCSTKHLFLYKHKKTFKYLLIYYFDIKLKQNIKIL